MAIEIVDFPINNGGSFHSYVSSPEGKALRHLDHIDQPHSPCGLVDPPMTHHGLLWSASRTTVDPHQKPSVCPKMWSHYTLKSPVSEGKYDVNLTLVNHPKKGYPDGIPSCLV